MNQSSPKDRAGDEAPPDSAAPLDDALRRARGEAAARADAASGRRVDDRDRLNHLLAAIQPLVRRIPRDADLFDVGVTHGFGRDGGPGRPRLFLDMIGFVECAPEGGYRLAQSSRHGRLELGAARDLAGATRLVADYIARRIVEREEALAGDRTVEDAALRLLARARESAGETAEAAGRTPSPARLEEHAPPRARPAPRAAVVPDDEEDVAPRPNATRARFAAVRARLARWRSGWRARPGGGALERGLVFAVQFLGAAALTLIVAMVAWWAWRAVGFVR